VVDVDVLRRFVRPWPDLAWQNIAAMCGRTITPVYKGLQTLLSDDVEHIAHLLSELEPFCHDDMIDDEVRCSAAKFLFRLTWRSEL